MKSKAVSNKKGTITDIIRATLLSLIFSLIGVLILALIVKLTSAGSNVILPVNQVLKILCVLLGCIFGIKNKEKGALKGLIIGLAYALLSVLVFLIINKKLDANSFNYIDIISGTVAGLLSGVIAVNIKRK